jgi:hypothetical protein
MSSNHMPATPRNTRGNTKKHSHGSGSPLASEAGRSPHPKKRSKHDSPTINSDTEVSVAPVEDGHEDTLVNPAPANDDNHNYSITRRWKKRIIAWDEWYAALCVDLDLEDSETKLNEALNTFEEVCKTKLFLTFDGKSQLGRKLLAFKAFFTDSLKEIAKRAAAKHKLEEKLKEPGVAAEIFEARNDAIVDQNELVKYAKALIEKEAAEVTYFISTVSEKHQALRSKLSVIKSKGNETAGTLFTTLPDSRITPQNISPARVDNIGPMVNPTLATSLIGSVGEPFANILELFHGYVVKLFEKASKTNDVEKVKNTVDALIAWEADLDLDLDSEKGYARPPTAEDKETSADQPILQAIISRVIRILAEGGKISDTSRSVLHDDEHGITSEQIIPSEGDRKRGRRVDGTVHPPEEYLPTVLALMLQLSVEIKTFPDHESMRNKALEKGRSQVVGHLGKQLAFSFDFGGAGKNATTLGIVLTTGSIEVIQMRLTGVGTVDVDLSATGTGVKAFLGTAADNGFVLLAGALKRARCDEIATGEMVSVCQIVPDGPSTRLHVEGFLGSGAFSNVVKLGESEFMKIPIAAYLAADLEREAKILSLLQCPGIPIPASSPPGVSTIETVVHDELSRMTCLRLRGVVGAPLNKLSRNDWQASAKDIVSQVVAALEFAHNKEVYHLDVQPGNIIVKLGGTPPCVVLLSDWGCSIHKNGKKIMLQQFRGCTPYAHDSLLGEWSGGVTLIPELDFASLLYTCIHVDQGILQWVHAFHHPLHVSTADMQMRRDLATQFVLPGGCFSTLGTTIQETLKSAVLPTVLPTDTRGRAGLRPVTGISYSKYL